MEANYLSFWGRVTLIKATLPNLPIYYFSLFKITKGVATEIERIQKQFLWSQAEFKPHYIKWSIFSEPKEAGGLAFGGISNKNIALLGKWLWRFYS